MRRSTSRTPGAVALLLALALAAQPLLAQSNVQQSIRYGEIKAIEAGVRADCFINMEPTDLNGLTLHAGSFNVVIELTGVTRHISKREEAVDAIAAACALVPRFDALTFSGPASPEHASVNRANIGVIRGSLTPEFHDWRPPQVADFARLTGSGRIGPGQTQDNALADLRRVLDGLQDDWPGLRAEVRIEASEEGEGRNGAFRHLFDCMSGANRDQSGIVEIPAQRLAVLRFSGFRDEDSVQARQRELLSGRSSTSWQPTSAPVADFYDPPWTLPFLRRSEVAVSRQAS